MMMDMQVPTSLPAYQNKTATRRLMLPQAGGASRTKPKPVPMQMYRRSSNLPMVLGMIGLVLLVYPFS